MGLMTTQVAPQWVDYNGHMNDAEYARVFSLGVEALMDRIGLDAEGRHQHGYTLYTLETHLCYRREAHQGQTLMVDVQMVDRDAKRLHVLFDMRDEEGNVLATSEQMLMGIDVASGRPAAFPDSVAQALNQVAELTDPESTPVGRCIGIPHR
uniref:thioesterase family protein n=1 Tax=Halomonas sp. TaxID=1486246 RepID=UPI00262B8E0E|nr:thioesterase family protein [Halomonas sp.]